MPGPGMTQQHTRSGTQAAAISTGLVSLLREYTGRGPVRARTTIDENMVVCVLGLTLTKSEQSLVEAGREKLVLRGRRAIQETMEDDARSLVEELTDRDVVAFMSNNHIDPDLAVETFILAPVATD